MSWRGLTSKIFWFVVVTSWFGSGEVHGQVVTTVGADGAGGARTIEASLQQMSRRAGVIFVGTVVDVRRSESRDAGPGIVEVRFAIEQAVRGCSGGTYTLREWGGFWSANDTRYRVGQRLVMLLHAPGAAGLSSPVGGMDGAIPLRASGAGVSSTTSSTAAADQVADLRWIGARLSRPVVYRNPTYPAATTRPAVPRAAAVTSEVSTGAGSSLTPLSDASKPTQEASVSAIVGLLRTWEVERGTTR